MMVEHLRQDKRLFRFKGPLFKMMLERYALVFEESTRKQMKKRYAFAL
jgi:hypothetical protein